MEFRTETNTNPSNFTSILNVYNKGNIRRICMEFRTETKLEGFV